MKWIIGILLLLLLACSESSVGKEEELALAKKYCVSCHLFPEPSLLPKKVWREGVLPEMGLRLGIGDRNTLLSKLSFHDFDALCKLGVYPDTPALALSEWKKIVQYYIRNAPSVLIPRQRKIAVETAVIQFDQQYSTARSTNASQTTMIRSLPEKEEIWVAGMNRQLDVFSVEGRWKQSIRTPSPVVDMLFDTEVTFLGIGNLKPNEDRNGRLFSFSRVEDRFQLLVDSLHRPVEMKQVELNGDGVSDLLIAEFGYITGQVRCIDGATNKQTILSTQPGARNILFTDANKDGLTDFYVLFTQAWEGVTLFTNKGGYQFAEEKIVEFHPAFGASFLDMADMDRDGDIDMIITNGDNADYSMVNKQYHGVHIFENSKGTFQEKYFYPVYGATKTIVRDFDVDGDMDMAMIAFFSPMDQSQRFLFFDQTSTWNFTASSQNVPQLPWLIMETDDVDRDGDMDIMLGAFNENAAEGSTKPNLSSFLLLKNRKLMP